MLKFILRRCLMMIFVVIGISFLVFCIMEIMPGDAAITILGPYATEESLAALRAELGLDQPFLTRYFSYMFNFVQGELGVSYRTQYPVATELLGRIPCTLKLSFGALVFVILIGVTIGIVSAVKQYSLIDTISLLLTMIATSMPAFWLGLLLMLLFSLRLGWLPATGATTIKHFILPWTTLAVGYMGLLVRMTRSSMLEVIRQDYIRTARAKGAEESTVIMKHALRNALLPIITVIGLNLGQMIGGSLVTETVFALPGVGTLLLSAIRQQDIPVVMATIMFIAVAIGIINLVVDILYAFVDPRLKTQYVKG